MKRNWQIFWHIVFWLSVLSYLIIITFNSGKVSLGSVLVIFLLFGVVNIGLFYLNYLYFIPKYLDKKQYKLYTLALVVSIVVSALGKYGLTSHFSYLVEAHEGGRVPSFW